MSRADVGNPAARFAALVKPCRDCPFVETNDFVLTSGRRHEIVKALSDGQTFFCHSTIEYGDDAADTTGSSRCFGAASVLHKSGYPPMQAEQVAQRLGLIDAPAEESLSRADTYRDLAAFLNGPTG